VTEDPRELARLRAKADEQEVEIARLREDAAEASDELAQLGAEARLLHRREQDLSALIERLRREARVHEDEISRLLERLAADERELDDLRAIRDALTPPDLASRPGIDLAASFLPVTERVSGDFYLVAEGPHDTTGLVVGDVVGKGLGSGTPSRVHPHGVRDHGTFLRRSGAAAQLGKHRPFRTRQGRL
jgi:serine phosphatase RsbU (regulator of sigma subunit)